MHLVCLFFFLSSLWFVHLYLCFVGILENHKLSLQMLKRSIDPVVSLKDTWWDNISNMKRNAVTAGKAAAKKAAAAPPAPDPARRLQSVDGGNVEPVQVISTDAIRAYIESNSTLTAHIEKVLRLEYKIYEMALAVHNAQCANLATQFPEIKCASYQ